MTTNAWNLSNFFSFSGFLFIQYGQVNIEEYVIHVKANSYIAYYNGIPLWKMSNVSSWTAAKCLNAPLDGYYLFPVPPRKTKGMDLIKSDLRYSWITWNTKKITLGYIWVGNEGMVSLLFIHFFVFSPYPLLISELSKLLIQQRDDLKGQG